VVEVKRHPSDARKIAAELAWLSENSRDDDIASMPKRRRRETWRSPELEAAMRRPSSQWPKPEGGIAWKPKDQRR
jgi:hypothetical protein